MKSVDTLMRETGTPYSRKLSCGIFFKKNILQWSFSTDFSKSRIMVKFKLTDLTTTTELLERAIDLYAQVSNCVFVYHILLAPSIKFWCGKDAC